MLLPKSNKEVAKDELLASKEDNAVTHFTPQKDWNMSLHFPFNKGLCFINLHINEILFNVIELD